MSAHVFQISDGTTTKSFISGNDMKLIRYQPLTSLDGEDVTERFSVNFTSKTPATNAANINTINKLFEQAKNYANTKTGAKVYAGFDPGTSGTVQRSLIRTGRIILNDEVLATRQYDQTLQLEIEWTRQGFWEGALTQIPLSNTSATDDTSGITVNNGNDAGTCQAETAVIVGTITGDGNASVTVTATGMAGSPITELVAVLNGDGAGAVATKMAAQLNTNSTITDLFYVSTNGIALIMTKLVPAANDTNLNIAYTNVSCTGLTPDATSNDTTAGSTTVHENWVSIDGSDVVGDIPAPIKVQMYNSYNSANEVDEIYIFHNVYSTPASLTHILEGEAATGATVSRAVAGAGDSTINNSGFYGLLTYTATTETLIATWELATAQLTYMAGGRFAVLSRYHSAFSYNDMSLRIVLTSANGSVLWRGDLVAITNYRALQFIDTLRLPPYLYGQANLKGIYLKLYALRNQAGAHSLYLDYIQLSPISGDGGFKRFLSVDVGVLYQEYFTHDAIEGYTYRTDTSSKIISEFTDYGGSINLVPGASQKLYFNSCDTNEESLVKQTWTVKLWYRPRRNSL